MVVRAFGNIPHALGILQQLLALGIAFLIPQRRQHDSQRLGVIQAVHRRQLVAEHMRRPVLWHACADQAVQRLRRRPHNIGAHVIVLRFLQGFRAILDQGQENAFGEAVLDFAVNRVGHVLLDGMDEGVNHAVRDLARRQGIGINRIEDRELRLDVRRHKRAFVAGGFPRYDRAFVGFRTGRRQSQYRAHWNGAGNFAAIGFQNFPRIDIRVVVGCCSDKLGAIQHRTAADRQQESDLLFAGELHRIHQGFVRRVRLDAAKFKDIQAIQSGEDLIQDACFFDAAAAVGDQYAGFRRDLFTQLFNRAFAKQNAGWGMQVEIIHCLSPPKSKTADRDDTAAR